MDQCRHCGQDLLPENAMMADGCPCNSGRGINHGIVDVLTCTCKVCDPEETGGSRFVSMSIIHSLRDFGDGTYVVDGTCACGLGASMVWTFTMPDGSLIPRCGKCARGDATGRFAKITKEAFEYFTALHVMTA